MTHTKTCYERAISVVRASLSHPESWGEPYEYWLWAKAILGFGLGDLGGVQPRHYKALREALGPYPAHPLEIGKSFVIDRVMGGFIAMKEAAKEITSDDR